MGKNLNQNGRQLVFVVDDDDLLRQVLVRCLDFAGFAVRGFPNAESALDVLELDQIRPLVLITDYKMPGMNGLELIAHFRKSVPEVKTVSISGTPVLPELSEPRCRPDRLLAKPFLPSELIAAVRGLIAEQA